MCAYYSCPSLSFFSLEIFSFYDTILYLDVQCNKIWNVVKYILDLSHIQSQFISNKSEMNLSIRHKRLGSRYTVPYERIRSPTSPLDETKNRLYL